MFIFADVGERMYHFYANGPPHRVYSFVLVLLFVLLVFRSSTHSVLSRVPACSSSAFICIRDTFLGG